VIIRGTNYDSDKIIVARDFADLPFSRMAFRVAGRYRNQRTPDQSRYHLLAICDLIICRLRIAVATDTKHVAPNIAPDLH